MVLPRVIQGGMGVGVSGWRLAGAVARAGGLGVVSGVALDATLARRLQDGDRGGHLRRALEAFPVSDAAEQVITRYFRDGGRTGQPYRPTPRLGLRQSAVAQRLAVVAAFAEVHLAREAGLGGPVGINLLEKIQMATPAAVYGAMLAGVDVVLVGAGIPTQLPRLLDTLAGNAAVSLPVTVSGAASGGGPAVAHSVHFDPAGLFGGGLPALHRPVFLAIVSSHVLAGYLLRDPGIAPDGFVLEGHIAGGHNAPPRGRLQVDDGGQPVYGPRDAVDLDRLGALGRPFWLAGGYGRPQRLAEALAAGAMGVQVGTPFALARESGLRPDLRQALLDALAGGRLTVRTDPLASPTGFPFKVAQLAGTLAEPAVYAGRERLCDLGYLRTPYVRPDGGIGYRCPAEPVEVYVRKGGDRADTVGRACLCNALTATIGVGQARRDGYAEVALVTLGSDLAAAQDMRQRHPAGWCAADVMAYLGPAAQHDPSVTGGEWTSGWELPVRTPAR